MVTEIKVISRYMYVEKYEEKPKTSVYHVYSVSDDVFLGEVKWWGPWRQYCFFPEEATIYSVGCMEDIVKFVKVLMEERKK